MPVVSVCAREPLPISEHGGHAMKDMGLVVRGAVQESAKAFREHPYDFLSSEREAKFRLYQLLKGRIPAGKVKVALRHNDAPIPPIEDDHAERVRIEFTLPPARRGLKPGIMVLRDGAHICEGQVADADIEALLELKITWGKGVYEAELGEALGKLREWHKKHIEVWFVVYIGNEASSVQDTMRRYAELVSSYHEIADRIYLVFRDQVIVGSELKRERD